MRIFLLLFLLVVNNIGFSRSVTIKNESPNLFSLYKSSKFWNPVKFFNHDYDHISEAGRSGHVLKIEIPEDKGTYLFVHQVGQPAGQMANNIKDLASVGVAALGFYNGLNQFREVFTEYPRLYTILECLRPLNGIITGATFGLPFISKIMASYSFNYEYIPAGVEDYTLIIRKMEGTFRMQKVRNKIKIE
mgnify:CR=1 FL=1